MKPLSILALAICPACVGADLSFDIRQNTIAHPSLGFKSKETVAHVMIQGRSVAIRENDLVQVANSDLNLVTLIDFRTQTFATSNEDEVRREDDKGFDSIQQDIRTELIRAGEPATWNGMAVKRDTSRTAMTGGDAPGEIRVTKDWIEETPELAESRRSTESADQRHVQELEANIQTLVFTHPERFADLLKVEKDASGNNGFLIHSVAEMWLAADAPMLKAIGSEYANRPIMSRETEILNFSTEPVDPGVFLVPSGFNQVEFPELLKQKYVRRHY